MAYTPENIANIKRNGDLDNYIAHERNLIAALENAEIDYDAQGKNSVSFAHLYGRFGVDTDNDCVVAHIVAGSTWSKEWTLKSFDGDQSRGMAYAKAALRNRLVEDGRRVLSIARERLAALEAAR